MKLEICINCFSYQKRLTWMLNSICQQKGDIPEILVSLSYTKDNGNPSTEKVIDFFRKQGLNILDIVLTPEEVSNRAIPRNIRAKETQADWIIFADCDLVYDPNFFADLKVKLLSDKYKNEEKVIGADRYSLDDTFCIKYFEEDTREYPCLIPNVADIAKKWPVKWIRGKERAAGFFQLARVSRIQERGGIYSGRKRDIWRSTKSDKQFRAHLGGCVGINTLPQYHLNHDRQGPNVQR